MPFQVPTISVSDEAIRDDDLAQAVKRIKAIHTGRMILRIVSPENTNNYEVRRNIFSWIGTIGSPTVCVCVTGAGAGVDSVREQRKLEARKLLENAADWASELPANTVRPA